MKPELTQERLKELLHYDPETGHFTWKKPSSNRVAIGSRAGFADPGGYVDIRIDSVLYPSHRLAWLYTFGRMPDGSLDHVNRVRDDNRIANLRPVSGCENARNISLSKRNGSGFRGVCWAPRERKWRAYGFMNGHQKSLGYFDDLVDAAQAARKWREENHGAFVGA